MVKGKFGRTSNSQNIMKLIVAPVLLDFKTPGESLAPWVLLLEQESYLSYVKKSDKKDSTDPFHF